MNWDFAALSEGFSFGLGMWAVCAASAWFTKIIKGFISAAA